MKKIMMATGAAAKSVALSGCTPTTEKAYTGTAPAAPTVWTVSPGTGAQQCRWRAR